MYRKGDGYDERMSPFLVKSVENKPKRSFRVILEYEFALAPRRVPGYG